MFFDLEIKIPVVSRTGEERGGQTCRELRGVEERGALLDEGEGDVELVAGRRLVVVGDRLEVDGDGTGVGSAFRLPGELIVRDGSEDFAVGVEEDLLTLDRGADREVLLELLVAVRTARGQAPIAGVVPRDLLVLLRVREDLREEEVLGALEGDHDGPRHFRFAGVHAFAGEVVSEVEVTRDPIRHRCRDEREGLRTRRVVAVRVVPDGVAVVGARIRTRVSRTSRSRKREEQGKDQRSRRLHEVTSCFRPWLGRVFLKVPNHAAGSFVLLFSYLFANLSTILTVHRFEYRSSLHVKRSSCYIDFTGESW